MLKEEKGGGDRITLEFLGPSNFMPRYFCLPVFVILGVHKLPGVNARNLGYLPVFI